MAVSISHTFQIMRVKFEVFPTKLKFRFPFKIAHGERTYTNSVIVLAKFNGMTGKGEATLPPYLPDTVESVLSFLEAPLFKEISADDFPPHIFYKMEELSRSDMPAKAAVDMALWNLKAQLEKKQLSTLLQINSTHQPPHSYTIGICTKEEMEKQLHYGKDNGFSFFKLKLNGVDDEKIIRNFKSLCNADFAVDANQSWPIDNKEYVLQIVRLLEQSNCRLIEQPYPKMDIESTLWLKKHTDLPLIADESCQRLSDIQELYSVFDGINIKLQKCGGLSEAIQMIQQARQLNMKVLIGCMSESAIGCDTAEALAPLCDWADLDGKYLITEETRVISSH